METAPHEDKVKEDGSTKEEMDPWNPPYPPPGPGPPVADLTVHIKLAKEWLAQKRAILATSRATKTITPDRTPERVNDALVDTLPRLTPILEKDSHRRFLSLFERNGHGMGWGYVITPETLDNIIMHNALQCARVALKGQAPQLNGFRANPNYMTQYGYFPLHRAAEMFSVEMIELLLRHRASANLRTSGPVVTEGLLPLHVAVENTCLHKYLEDGLFRDQKHQDCCGLPDVKYVYKLIHLLCLPELKIFMDTVRLLAKHTDNLLDQLCDYINDGKLAQTAVLLLAAQEQIRAGTSHKSNKVNSKLDGFAIITGHIAHNIALACEDIMDPNQLRRINFNNLTLSLVDVISRAGEALDSYIRAQPKLVPCVKQVPHSEVLERVSLILKEHGFVRTVERIDLGNLCPYTNALSNKDLRTLEEMVATKSTTEVGCHAAKEEDRPIKKITTGWELKYARRSFFPYWRSVLEPQSSAKMSFIKPMLTEEQINHDRGLSKSTSIESTFGRPKGGVPQPIANHQPRRLFGTAASTLLKLLKNV